MIVIINGVFLKRIEEKKDCIPQIMILKMVFNKGSEERKKRTYLI